MWSWCNPVVSSQSLAVRIIFTKVYFPKYYIHPTGMDLKNWSLKRKKLYKNISWYIQGLNRSWMCTNNCTKSSLKYHVTTVHQDTRWRAWHMMPLIMYSGTLLLLNRSSVSIHTCPETEDLFKTCVSTSTTFTQHRAPVQVCIKS